MAQGQQRLHIGGAVNALRDELPAKCGQCPVCFGQRCTALERAGATPAQAGAASSSLKITSEGFNTRPLSVDQFARVREYITVYQVGFVLLDAAGKPLIEPQQIELSREYTYDVSESAGSPAEQELIQRELRRDMEASILRRLDVVLRTRS